MTIVLKSILLVWSTIVAIYVGADLIEYSILYSNAWDQLYADAVILIVLAGIFHCIVWAVLMADFGRCKFKEAVVTVSLQALSMLIIVCVFIYKTWNFATNKYMPLEAWIICWCIALSIATIFIYSVLIRYFIKSVKSCYKGQKI